MGLTGSLGRMSRNGPAKVALPALISAWVLGGARGKMLALKKANFLDALRTGTAPVGINAAWATLFLVVVFLLI